MPAKKTTKKSQTKTSSKKTTKKTTERKIAKVLPVPQQESPAPVVRPVVDEGGAVIITPV